MDQEQNIKTKLGYSNNINCLQWKKFQLLSYNSHIPIPLKERREKLPVIQFTKSRSVKRIKTVSKLSNGEVVDTLS